MKYIIANWKMNMNLQDICTWISDFAEFTHDKQYKSQIVLAPSIIYLKDTLDMVKHLKINVHISAQDVSENKKGAFTGMVSAAQLKDYCMYSIIGHTETHTTKQNVFKKRTQCLENAITPIVCFSEINEAREYEMPQTILAWEDPTNISKNGIYIEKDPEEIKHGFYEMRLALNTESELIYGGSVNRKNAQVLAKIDGLNGVLVGNASLDPKHFTEIIEVFEEK